jgi:hypothetical protein
MRNRLACSVPRAYPIRESRLVSLSRAGVQPTSVQSTLFSIPPHARVAYSTCRVRCTQAVVLPKTTIVSYPRFSGLVAHRGFPSSYTAQGDTGAPKWIAAGLAAFPIRKRGTSAVAHTHTHTKLWCMDKWADSASFRSPNAQ